MQNHCQAASQTRTRRFVVMTGWAAAIATLLGVTACGKEPPPPTVVNLKLSATAKVNASADGTGAPVQVRVFQLASSTTFAGQEFYPLWKTDTAVLSKDLIKKDEFILAPGKDKTLELTLDDPVKAIGVFAVYRDFQNVKWRVAADVPAHKTTNLTVTLDQPGLKLSGATDTTPGP